MMPPRRGRPTKAEPKTLACVDIKSRREGDQIVVNWQTPNGPEDSHTLVIDLNGTILSHDIFETLEIPKA